MYIEVKGCRKKFREEIARATEWAANKLIHPRTREILSIEVHIKKLDDKLLDGQVDYEDDDWRPREFVIELSNENDLDTTLETLMHEMVHVKQWVKQELAQRVKTHPHWMWKGKTIKHVKHKDLPWEKEAYSLQTVLKDEYLSSLKTIT